MVFIRTFFFLIFLFCSFLYSKDLEKVSLQLKWKHQFQFAGYYMAKEKGFYKDLGFDVEIKEAHNNQDTTHEVLNSNSTFGISDSVLIYDKMIGKDVYLLGAIFQQSPFILLSLKDTNIKDIKDLKNKKIMLDLNIRNNASILSMLKKYNFDEGNVTLVPTNYDVKSLIKKEVDVFTAYISNEPHELKKKGIDYSFIKPSDYGFNFYGDILFTSKDYYNKNRNSVKKFYEASLKGWKYAFNNIDETIKIILKKYNTNKLDYDHLLYEANVLKELSEIDQGNLGKLEKSRIIHIKNVYFLMTEKFRKIDFDNLMLNNEEGSKESLKEELRDKTIKVCYSKDLEPYTYKEDGKAIGISIDYLKLVAKKANLNLEFVETQNVQKHFELVQKGTCDVLPTMLKEPNTRKMVIPTKEYSFEYLALSTKIEQPYIAREELFKGKKIGINKNYANVIKFVKEKYPEIDLITMSLDEGLKKVKKGEIYGYVDGYLVLSSIIKKEYHGSLKIMKTLEEAKVLLSFGVNEKQNLLREVLSNSIDKITSKERNRIENSWNKMEVKKIVDYTLFYQLLFVTALILISLIYRERFLRNINIKLKEEVKRQVDENRKKDNLMFQQSKLAAMGEMINNIAHQWRQPLNRINSNLSVLNILYEGSSKNKKTIDEKIDNIEKQIDYMSNTIEDFLSFLHPKKQISRFDILETIENTVKLIDSRFKNVKLDLKYDKSKNFRVNSYESEMIQVLLSIFDNAVDNFDIKKRKNAEVKVELDENIQYVIIKIVDNGGGIEEEILEKVFEPYFTTKSDLKSSGLGLYISKMIVENSMKGSITVSSNNKETCFEIKVKKEVIE